VGRRKVQEKGLSDVERLRAFSGIGRRYLGSWIEVYMDDWIVNMGWMDLEWKSWGWMGCEGKKEMLVQRVIWSSSSWSIRVYSSVFSKQLKHGYFNDVTFSIIVLGVSVSEKMREITFF
jgi:hypothetical protein